MEQHEAAQIISLLVASFPDQKWSDDTIAAYEMAVSEHPFEAAQAALKRLMATLKFRPSIAELVGMCVDVQLGTRKTGIEAWEELCTAIRVFGSYRNPKFDDPLVEQAMKMIGGWRYVCLSENEASDRARFADAYDTLVDKQRVNIASGVPLLTEGQRQSPLLTTTSRGSMTRSTT
jgi:hypothetical protein